MTTLLFLGLAGDTAYRAANTGTLGALDYGLAGVHAIERGTGYDPNATDLATIHKQNEEWGNAHPYLGLGADLVGYSAGFGKLGLGAKLAERAGGSSPEVRGLGAGAGAYGASAVSNEAATQGQIGVGDLLKQAAISGTVGGVTGLIPGGKGAMADMPSPTKALEAKTAAAFTPLETTHYDPNAGWKPVRSRSKMVWSRSKPRAMRLMPRSTRFPSRLPTSKNLASRLPRMI